MISLPADSTTVQAAGLNCRASFATVLAQKQLARIHAQPPRISSNRGGHSKLQGCPSSAMSAAQAVIEH
jgi:hypothetical protein